MRHFAFCAGAACGYGRGRARDRHTHENDRAARPIHLKDYRPPAYRIPEIALDFQLDPEATRVKATMKVERASEAAPLVLDGNGLKLIRLKIDGKALDKTPMRWATAQLTIHAPPAKFTLEIVTEIAPAQNTRAGRAVHLQRHLLHADASRKVFAASPISSTGPTIWPDTRPASRPERQACPVMLSNGNLHRDGRTSRRPPFRALAGSVPQAVLSVRAGGGRSRAHPRHSSPPCPGARSIFSYLCRARQRGQSRTTRWIR